MSYQHCEGALTQPSLPCRERERIERAVTSRLKVALDAAGLRSNRLSLAVSASSEADRWLPIVKAAGIKAN
jgi:hypothetical protein